jgi:hypothetical protein
MLGLLPMPRAKALKLAGPSEVLRLSQLETEVEQLGSELYVLRRSLVEVRTLVANLLPSPEEHVESLDSVTKKPAEELPIPPGVQATLFS